VRFYGRDFTERVVRMGFDLLHEETAYGADVVKYSLIRGDKIFLFRRQ
jgi:hypothetical protein